MLVLSRKLDEAIWLGDNIKIKIMGIEKGVVKLGIDAPSDISIVRNELIENVTDANKAAATDVSTDELNILSKMLKK